MSVGYNRGTVPRGYNRGPLGFAWIRGTTFRYAVWQGDGANIV